MNAHSFMGNISMWNTSSATTMEATFARAGLFNSNLSQWDVSRVARMLYMFYGAETFEGGDLTRWNVSQVDTMASMFFYGSVFNGIVTTWDTRKLHSMEEMVRVTRVIFWFCRVACQLLLSHDPS
jgi:Mycoplasma protein of unknown function, DUF285